MLFLYVSSTNFVERLLRSKCDSLVRCAWIFQVFGDIKLLSGSSLSFGLARYPTSEFELMADAFFMENSRLMVCEPSRPVSCPRINIVSLTRYECCPALVDDRGSNAQLVVADRYMEH